MKPRHGLIAALAFVVVLVAGCGGGDDSSTSTAATTVPTTTTTLTKEELIAQGDAICAEVNAAIGTVAATGAAGGSQVSQEAELYAGMVERLKGLGTPSEAAGYAEFIAAADELAQAEGDAQLAFERGEESALAEAQTNAASALASFQAAAQAYGFESCGEGPSAPVATTPSEEPSAESGEVVEEVEEAAPEEVEPAPETGGAGGPSEEAGGGTSGGTEGGGVSGGGSGGIGPE